MSDYKLPIYDPATAPLRERACRALESFFWNTLCCRPDGGPIHAWWYHHTGNAARFFHRLHCRYCLDTRSRPWKKKL